MKYKIVCEGEKQEVVELRLFESSAGYFVVRGRRGRDGNWLDLISLSTISTPNTWSLNLGELGFKGKRKH